jgi:alpha-N-arabinofuranosidase
MSMIAQTVNVLQAMILTDGKKMILTPTYHVFRMHIPFQGATLLPADVETPDYRRGEHRMPAVDVSAARGEDGRVHVALVNLDPRRPATVSAGFDGIRARGASGEILTAREMDAHNTFDRPDALQPVAFTGRREGDAIVFDLPPKSVAVVTLDE